MPLARAAVAAALFVVAWALLHHGFYAGEQIVDTPIYERYGAAMVNGEVPYRDFGLEYPPAALPVFLLPAVGGADADTYRRRFEALLAGLGVACVLLVAATSASWWAPFFVAVAPVLLGSVMLSRFDLWPAAITAAALALLVAGRPRLGLGTLGLAAAAKLYPAVIFPLALAHVWRSRGRREALLAGAAFAGVVAAFVMPFALLAPGGVWDAFSRQAGRPLQLESLGASILLAARQFGAGLEMESSHGSQNLAGDGSDALAILSTLVQVAALAAIWLWHARGPATRERLVLASAAAVCAFVAFGKVLSPQFLIWLVPLVPLVRGRVGVAASALLAAALVLTQLWFPYRYWELALEFDAVATWLVVARDAVLVAVTLLLAARVRPAPSRSS